MNGLDVASKAVALLGTQIDPEEVVGVVQEMLGATRVNVRKTKEGGLEEKREPDWLTRKMGVQLYMDYVVGKPVQRVAVAHSNLPESEEDALNTILSSPASLEALIRTIAEQPGGRAMLHQMSMSERDRQLAAGKNMPNP